MKQSHQWDAGSITIEPPPTAPEGCPPCVLSIGTVTVVWGEDDPLPPQPDWAAFREAFFAMPMFARIAASPFYADLSSVMWQLSNSPQLFPAAVRLWDLLVSTIEISAAEIAELNTIANANHIPFALNAEGKMQ